MPATSTLAPNAHPSSGDPTTFLPHPDDMPDVYATVCVGTCLEPVIADKTCLVFDKREECHPGDFVVLVRKPECVPSGETSGLVKRLVMGLGPVRLPYPAHSSSEVVPIIIVEMLNPWRQMAIKATDLLAMHKCIGVGIQQGNGRAVVQRKEAW